MHGRIGNLMIQIWKEKAQLGMTLLVSNCTVRRNIQHKLPNFRR
ncbi:hypothetical protein PSEUDO9AZ_40823 [Pseudomonas sp. 9AZ]|nr:hypothetical protein PSEUDO9AZ_40823 [Pseudomonas sp. 9AZ]